MADTSASNPGGSCLDKLISYAKTQKGLILAAEMVSSLTFTPKSLLQRFQNLKITCALKWPPADQHFMVNLASYRSAPATSNFLKARE